MTDINDKIKSARKNLRLLYEKYQKEYYEINLKIDNYLAELESNTE